MGNRPRRLASAWRKFDRGEVHRKALEADVLRVGKELEGKQIPIHVDVEWQGETVIKGELLRRGTATAFFGDDTPRLSDDFPLILGDAIANYRDALDHLTWALVKRFGAKLNPKQARSVQFPMHRSARDFEAHKGQRTPGVPDTPHRAILKRYQPYRRGDAPLGIRWIRTLADVDKHRVVNVADLSPDRVRTQYDVSKGCGIVGPVNELITEPVPLKPGTKLATFTVVAGRHVRQCKVDVQGHMTIRPVIRKRVDALGAANLSGRIVEEILESFGELL